MSLATKKVFARRGDSVMSQRSFVALLTTWTLLGLAVSALGSWFTYGAHLSTMSAFGLVMLSFFGVILTGGSVGSTLVGYSLITLSLGMLLGPGLAEHTKASVVNVLGTTFILTVGMGGIGFIWPKSLEGWFPYLFGVLLLLIIARFSLPIFAAVGLPVTGAFTGADWLGAGLFCAFIVFDFNRSMRVPRTLENSLDCAVALYLDIINLFSSLLATKDD